MAKRVRKKRRVKRTRQTNWVLIGGIVAVGVIGLFALLFAFLQPGAPTPALNFTLAAYCEANPDNCVAQGAADAPVTFVEISEYGCGHCRNFNLKTADTLVAQYVEPGQVRWLVVPFAFRDQTGRYATLPTASAALCASEQDRFFAFHKAMFELQGGELFNTRAGFVQTAADLDMDVDALTSCIDSGRYDDVVVRNSQTALGAGVSATPTFFINGQKVEGDMPLPSFQQQINALLGA